MDGNDIELYLQNLINLERNSELYGSTTEKEKTAGKQYERPNCTYTDLLLIVLLNTESRALPVESIRAILCVLFPYFKHVQGLASGIWAAVVVRRKSLLFLKGETHCSLGERLVILNPAEKLSSELRARRAAKRLRLTCFECMSKPELLESLEQGTAKLDTWALDTLQEQTTEENVSQSDIIQRISDRNCNEDNLVTNNEKETERPVTQGLPNEDNSLTRFLAVYNPTIEELLKSQCLREGSGGDKNKNNVCSKKSKNGIISNKKIQESQEDNHPTETLSGSTDKRNYILGQLEDNNLPVITEVVSMAASCEDGSQENEQAKDRSGKTEPQVKNVNLKRSNNLSPKLYLADGKPLAEVHPKRRKCVKKKDVQTHTSENNMNGDFPAKAVENSVHSTNVGQTCSTAPELSGCIETWKKVFPWVVYCEKSQSLICESCRAGSIDAHQFEVIILSDPSKTFSAARALRTHGESSHHKDLEIKKVQVQKLLRALYPIINGHLQEISGLPHLTDLIYSQGVLPELMLKECIISYMIKHISNCLQQLQLKELEQCQFFSVLLSEENNLAVIRWINKNGESEEHLFFSPKSNNIHKTVKKYLKDNNIDINKITYCRSVPHLKCVNLKTLELPSRLPSLDKFLSWLENTALFKDMFHYLEIFTKLCKSSHYRFAQFPEAEEFLTLEKPFSHNCVKSKKILNFFLKNNALLKVITQTIYNQTGNLEALGCTSLDMRNLSSLELAEALFPRLSDVLTKEEHDHSCAVILQELRKVVAEKLKSLTGDKSEEEKVLTFIDIFLSYTLLGIYSKKEETVSIFYKKLNQVTTFVMEKTFSRFLPEFQGSSCELLQNIHAVRIILGKKKCCTLLDLLEEFGKRPELCGAYPKLYRFYMIVKTLPCIPAKVELNMFDIALAYGTFSSKFDKNLVLPLAHISLEGPSSEKLNEDYIVDEWFCKWRKQLQEQQSSGPEDHQ